MTRTALVIGLFAIVLSSSVGGPSLTSAVLSPESRYTDIARTGCEAGPDAEGRALMRCPGLGGARVLVSLDRERIGIGFAWSSREARADLIEGGSLEPRLEWRGLATSKGFEPYAVLVRTGWGMPGARDSITVVRFRPGAACLVGEVSRRTDHVLVSEARALADEQARTGTCSPDGA